MLPDLSEELQQLCEYLQQDSVPEGATGFISGNASQADTGSSNYIPTVVGTTAERMEPIRDTLSSDHLYHKVIEPTVVTTVLNNNTKRVDIVNSTRVLHKVVSASVNESSISLASSPKSESMFMDDNDCVFDIGSEGNRSPYSDISSSLSPGTPEDLGLDWNDSFVDLFPQLSA